MTASCEACRGPTDTRKIPPRIRNSTWRRYRASSPIQGSSSATLNLALPSLSDHLGLIKRPMDEWIDRNPGGKIIVCEANRIKYKGNWKLAYDNSGDGYHVLHSHRSLLEMENCFQGEGDRERHVLLQGLAG